MINPEHNTQLAAMLVELDCILDTRLGTIAKFGREIYGQVISSDYYSRKSDHFEGVDSDKYFELYRERDAVTLSCSMITHVVSIVKDFVTRVNIISHTAPVKKTPRVDINTYPYNIPDELMDNIIKALRVHINDKVDIGHVRYSPDDLHYDLVKHTYDHLVMYNIGDFISAQAQDWNEQKKTLLDTTIFFPILCLQQDREQVPEDVVEKADDIRALLSSIINPMQLPIGFFCNVLNPNTLSDTPSETEVPEGVQQ